jgi:protease-4
MDKIGVQSLTLTEGKDKDMLSPFRPWKQGEEQSLQDIISYNYELFVSVVTGARKNLDKEKLVNEYGAQIYDARKGQELGYVEVGGSDYATALRDLVKAAGIPETEHYQVFQIESGKSFLSDLTANGSALLSGKITHTFQLSPYFNSNLSGKFLYLYQPAFNTR